MLSIVKGPYLQRPTQTSIIVMWETSAPASSKVTFAEARSHPDSHGGFRSAPDTEQSLASPDLKTMHAVTLQGLQEDTSYHYRVESVSAAGEFPLKTAVSTDGPFSFAVTSETACTENSSVHKNVYEAMLRYLPEFVLFLGDAVADGRIEEEWKKTLFGPGKNLLANTPFYLCLGNHEECAPRFYELVSYPQPKRYYSFDYGNTHFVSLDSTSPLDYKEGRKTPDDAGGDFRPGGEQYDFLVNDLQSTL